MIAIPPLAMETYAKIGIAVSLAVCGIALYSGMLHYEHKAQAIQAEYTNYKLEAEKQAALMRADKAEKEKENANQIGHALTVYNAAISKLRNAATRPAVNLLLPAVSASATDPAQCGAVLAAADAGVERFRATVAAGLVRLRQSAFGCDSNSAALKALDAAWPTQNTPVDSAPNSVQ